jgi:ribosome assembly protein YihI (activator of Der GTPase)
VIEREGDRHDRKKKKKEKEKGLNSGRRWTL